MRRKWQGTALLLTAILALGGCGSAQDAAVTAESAASETAATAQEAEGTETAASAQESAETAESAASEGTSGAAEKASSAETDPEGTHTVTDHGGNVVEVPNKITRVVIDQIPILSTYMAYFEGSAPYIVGYAGSLRDTISDTALKNIAPELLESEETVYAQSDINIEEIIKLKPDVILYNTTNTEHAELLKASGIPAVGFATDEVTTPSDPMTRYQEWLHLLEDVFDEPGKMDNFLAKGQEITEDVEARIAEIPEEERPSGMILFNVNNGVPIVTGQKSFGYYWLEHLGVKNVAEETQGFAQTSFEQLYKWDPEVMFLNGPGLSPLTETKVLNNEVEGADFSTMQAVKNGRVYDTKLGMWNWLTPNPDAPLILAWMAYNTYPEQFKDYPLEETIREYYKTFYDYEVTDEEMEGMLALR